MGRDGVRRETWRQVLPYNSAKGKFMENEAAQEGKQQPLICGRRWESTFSFLFISFLFLRAAGTLRKRRGLQSTAVSSQFLLATA